MAHQGTILTKSGDGALQPHSTRHNYTVALDYLSDVNVGQRCNHGDEQGDSAVTRERLHQSWFAVLVVRVKVGVSLRVGVLGHVPLTGAGGVVGLVAALLEIHLDLKQRTLFIRVYLSLIEQHFVYHCVRETYIVYTYITC